MSIEPGDILEKRFPNRLDDLGRATDEAVRFVQARGVGHEGVYRTNLVIEELATNILKYGYDDTATHEILLRLELHPGTIVLVLEDDGHEFNPLLAPEPDVNLPAEQRDPGGLGIHLIRKMVDDIQYQRCGGRNRLTISIRS